MRYYLSLCAIMKNEGPYLEEWLEFHMMVGVQHFYLYDNNSTDETQDVLEKYINSGTVTYQYWAFYPGQKRAYFDCLKKYKNDSFWIGFIDLDEFIVPTENDSIHEILKDFEKFGGLGINWIMYGNSGHETKPAGLQIKNFIFRAKKEWKSNRHIKSIVNPRTVKSPFNDPHCFKHLPGFFTVTENREKINCALTDHHSSKKIRINHYFTRSKEESRKKMERGRGFSKGTRPWHDFERLNKNDVHDSIMERFVSELEKRMFG